MAGKRLLIAAAGAAAVIGSGGRRVAAGRVPIIAMVIIDDGDDGVRCFVVAGTSGTCTGAIRRALGSIHQKVYLLVGEVFDYIEVTLQVGHG